MKGIVKVMYSKGFGFIKVSDYEPDVFFHMNDMIDKEVSAGTAVVFDVIDGPRGPKATNVKKL